MKAKAWTLLTYGLNILFLLALLLLKNPDARLIAVFLIMIDMAGLLTILGREKWDVTHYLGLCLLLLTSIFLLLYLAYRHTGVTYLYGGVLILASMVLLAVELIAGWRSYKIIDRLMKKNGPLEEETPIETLEPLKPKERLFAKQGSTTYHMENCRTLQQTKVVDLVQLTREEADAYEMHPCKVCKP